MGCNIANPRVLQGPWVYRDLEVWETVEEVDNLDNSLLKVTLILARVPQEAGSEMEICVCRRCLGVCPWEKLIEEAGLGIFNVVSAKVSVHP